MLKNKLIIIPIENPWNHSADFLRQTALTLSLHNKVVVYDQNNAYFFLKKTKSINYPIHKNIYFHRVKYFLPFRRFSWIESLNRKLSFYFFLLKNRKMQKILWIFYPNYYPLARIKNKKMISIYDCVDFSQEFENETKLINSVDYFFVNSISLKKVHKNKKNKAIYINAQGFFLPDDKKVKKINFKKNQTIIGYIGGINYRLNFPLLNELIKNNPQWQFIFYGPVQKYPKEDILFKTKYWIKKIKSYKNVSFGKSTDRYKVYGLIKNFDVAIIPYNPNVNFNKYCYPMKVFEYLYFGKPIVSSDIEELKAKKFKKFIRIAKNNSDWEKHIAHILEHQFSSIISEQGKQLAIFNSWSYKINKISKLVISN